ncbi:hypothetical protein [Rhodococcus qingshengii]|uniref:hypothetical protein n=1 Tax=Rhodococcus qingshengii TaxID=334542 RepID=UPI0022B42B6E|nr:hypothetical protein [Rhodococcus qingshengii]MCZ4618454.1 hypothetical protein [Rhodococcus qingshengii]
MKLAIPHRFFIDENGFVFTDQTVESIESALREFSDTLDFVAQDSKEICKWSQIWFIRSTPDEELLDLLNGNKEIDRDIARRISLILDRVDDWDNDFDINLPSLGVVCGEEIIEIAPSIVVCGLTKQNLPTTACLTTLQSNRSGKLAVNYTDKSYVDVRFIASPAGGVEYWRDVILFESKNAQDLNAWSKFAFPDLIFPNGIWSQIGNFDGRFRDNLPKIVKHLSGLNDHARNIWIDHSEPAEIMAYMGSLAGIDCSKDSPNTHKNSSAMASRRVYFEDGELLCEWHTKLEKDKNRIHFAVENEKVYVGIFAKHLIT